MSKSPRASRVKEEVSADLAALIAQKKQILEWKAKVTTRLVYSEDIYLKETQMGNIIRGFDQDASIQKEKNRNRDNKESDEKEKLFSGSSYAVWMERQHAAKLKDSQTTVGIPQVSSQSNISENGPAIKKQKI